ncbi:hypothetical protein F5B19DRAFT_82512 [Rostrohypoxylon terebratum]|nr:hypothetical protein F5B19DRAFT_82512 [Rostrohypoxylon terebratum]
MARSTSYKSNDKSSWLKACLRCCGCFPMEREKKPTPGFHAIPYANTQPAAEPYMSGALPLVEYPRIERKYLPSNHSQSTLARPGTASSLNTVRSPLPGNSGNTYGNNSGDPRSNWAKADLTPSHFTELLDSIHDTLSHVPYAVCGLAALYDHGYSTRRLNAVSILCPEHSKDNIRGWLRTRGYDTYQDFFGIPIGPRGYGGEGAFVYRVRVKWLDDDNFARVERIKSQLSNAWVLGLADQLDYCAMSFMFQYRIVEDLKKHVAAGGKSQELARCEGRLRMAAQDTFWCLDKAARTHHHLDMKALTMLTSERFWVPFTTMYARARPEMARAGIDVAAVLKKHRDLHELREHEAMLKQFGVGQEAVVTQQPGPFEGMQTLANNRSVYSVANGVDSQPTIPLEPLPTSTSLSVRSSLSAKAKPFVPSRSVNREHLLAGLRRVSSVGGSGKNKGKGKGKGKSWKGKGKGKDDEAERGRPTIGKPTNPTGTTHGGQNLKLGCNQSTGPRETDSMTESLPRPSMDVERPKEWV